MVWTPYRIILHRIILLRCLVSNANSIVLRRGVSSLWHAAHIHRVREAVETDRQRDIHRVREALQTDRQTERLFMISSCSLLELETERRQRRLCRKRELPTESTEMIQSESSRCLCLLREDFHR